MLPATLRQFGAFIFFLASGLMSPDGFAQVDGDADGADAPTAQAILTVEHVATLVESANAARQFEALIGQARRASEAARENRTDAERERAEEIAQATLTLVLLRLEEHALEEQLHQVSQRLRRDEARVNALDRVIERLDEEAGMLGR